MAVAPGEPIHTPHQCWVAYSTNRECVSQGFTTLSFSLQHQAVITALIMETQVGLKSPGFGAIYAGNAVLALRQIPVQDL
jgi:hypothetical protein